MLFLALLQTGAINASYPSWVTEFGYAVGTGIFVIIVITIAFTTNQRWIQTFVEKTVLDRIKSLHKTIGDLKQDIEEIKNILKSMETAMQHQNDTNHSLFDMIEVIIQKAMNGRHPEG